MSSGNVKLDDSPAKEDVSLDTSKQKKGPSDSLLILNNAQLKSAKNEEQKVTSAKVKKETNNVEELKTSNSLTEKINKHKEEQWASEALTEEKNNNPTARTSNVDDFAQYDFIFLLRFLKSNFIPASIIFSIFFAVFYWGINKYSPKYYFYKKLVFVPSVGDSIDFGKIAGFMSGSSPIADVGNFAFGSETPEANLSLALKGYINFKYIPESKLGALMSGNAHLTGVDYENSSELIAIKALSTNEEKAEKLFTNIINSFNSYLSRSLLQKIESSESNIAMTEKSLQEIDTEVENLENVIKSFGYEPTIIATKLNLALAKQKLEFSLHSYKTDLRNLKNQKIEIVQSMKDETRLSFPKPALMAGLLSTLITMFLFLVLFICKIK
jgi:hypothetical protein